MTSRYNTHQSAEGRDRRGAGEGHGNNDTNVPNADILNTVTLMRIECSLMNIFTNSIFPTAMVTLVTLSFHSQEQYRHMQSPNSREVDIPDFG
jgi:hypothetical protein